MTRTLSPPLARFVVLAPTLLFSLLLGSFGFSPLPRLAAGLCLGAVLILLVARYQRRSRLELAGVIDPTARGAAR
jgi:hypothetical protein